MKALARNVLLSLLCLAAASAQSAIFYNPGPAPHSPPTYIPSSQIVDLDGDGLPDFSVWSSGPITTMDLQTTSLVWPYYVGAAGTNQMLISGYDASLQPLGGDISSNVPSGATWATPWFGAGLGAAWSSGGGQIVGGQLVYSGWYGPLADLGVAYLPVHLHTPDGSHYGWIRIRLPGPGGFLFDAPAAVDWAYETNPESPIRAGDIGSTEESLQFTVALLASNRRPHQPPRQVGTASLILTGTTLRGEISLAGQFSSAQILDPTPRGKGRIVSDFGQPLVSTASHTTFFHDASLTRSQVVHLLHGTYSLSIDNGALEARIVPVPPVHHGHKEKH